MEVEKKGKCTNFGNCKNADGKAVQTIPITADFVCSECERELEEVVETKKGKLSKPLLIAIPILIILFGAGSYVYYWYAKAKKAVDTVTDVVNTASALAKDTATINVVKGAVNTVATLTENNRATNTTDIRNEVPPQPASTTTHTPPTSIPSAARNLQECFNKLSSSQISYSSKDQLVNNALAYFTSPSAKVTTIGENNTDVEDISAKDFVETIRTANRHYTFVSGQKSGDKYSSITVKEE